MNLSKVIGEEQRMISNICPNVQACAFQEPLIDQESNQCIKLVSLVLPKRIDTDSDVVKTKRR